MPNYKDGRISEEYLTERTDNGILRTAIIVNEKETASFDIVNSDGDFICRLNVSSFNAEHANVDVIVKGKDRITAKAWEDGTPMLDSIITSSLLAADIRKGKA